MAFGVKNIHRKQKEPEKKKSEKKKSVSRKPGLLLKLKNKFKTYKRVLRITKKPSAKEFTMIVKVTSLGIALIGAVGFVIWFILTLLE